MKAKLSFGKSVIICVISFFAVSTSFTGCSDYDGDIDDLHARIDSLASVINEIKTRIGSGNYVTGVTYSGNTLTISYTNGTPTSLAITGAKGDKGDTGSQGPQGSSGLSGAPGTSWDIDEERGVWIMDNQLTDIPAKPAPSPYVRDSDSQWIEFVWNKEDTAYVEFETGRFFVPGQSGQPGQPGEAGTPGSIVTMELVGDYFVWAIDGELTDIPASGAPSPILRVDDFGVKEWFVFLWSYVDTTYQESATGITFTDPLDIYVVKNTGEGGGWILHVWNSDDERYEDILLPMEPVAPVPVTIEFLGFAPLTSLADNIRFADLDQDLAINSYEIEHIYATWITATYDTTWTHGTKSINVGDVITSLVNCYAVMRYEGGDPAGQPFTLQNSTGDILPLALSSPIPYEGLLTKAVSNSSLYVMRANIGNIVNPSDFKTDAVYRLVTTAGKSNYGKQTVTFNTTTPSSIVEAKVEKIGTNTVTAGPLIIVSGRTYTLSFDDDQHLLDYYVESTVANDATFEFSGRNGSFSFSGAGTASIYVYKLHVDGNIYRELISLTIVD